MRATFPSSHVLIKRKQLILIFKCMFVKVESCGEAQADLEHPGFLPLYIRYFSHGYDQVNT